MLVAIPAPARHAEHQVKAGQVRYRTGNGIGRHRRIGAQSGHPEDSPRGEPDGGVRGHREVAQRAVVNGGDDGRAG